MKNLTFFTEEENLVCILQNNFPKNNIDNINKISTGWTNIVLEFDINGITHIARFPRNNFFSKMIKKDVSACQFLKNQLNLKTTDMKLFYDDNRAFSVHEKLPGIDLSQRFPYLSQDKKNKIAEDIAIFYNALHNTKKNLIPNELNTTLSDFFDGLAKVDDDYYDYTDNILLKEDEQKDLVLVHGDLNIRNILLNENDDVTAFIDFAFVGLSERHVDLSRMFVQVDGAFLNNIIHKYEEISHFKIDQAKIEKRNKMWKYIEEQYVVYMKHFHPEIILPC